MRVLAIAVFSFAAAIFTSVYCAPLRLLPLLAGLAVLPGILLFATRRRWVRGFALMFCGLAVGFGFFYGHAMRTIRPAERLSGETHAIRAQLVDWPQDYERYVRAEIRLHTKGLPPLKCYLYDNGGTLLDAEPGQWLECQAKLRTADTLYGEDYKGYQAKGIYLIANTKEVQLEKSGRPDLRFLPQRLNRLLSQTVWSIFPEDTAAFFQSLLLGDKTELYKDLTQHLTLSRAGLMHIVAVSGMHVTFLVGLIRTAFGRSRRSTYGCLVLVWLFVLVTGAGPSAVRAGVMQSMVLIAPLIGRENDSLTSLAAALGFILLGNPCAAASVSLQLSFGSIAGILFFAGRLSQGLYSRWPALQEYSLGRTSVGAVVNSLAVMPFSVPLIALHFGTVALLSPLTNLLCLWAVSFCFCGAALLCVLGLFWNGAAVWLAQILAWLARYILFVAGRISAISFATIYLEFRWSVLWLVLSYLLFLGFSFIRRSAWIRFGVPALCSALSLAALLGLIRLDYLRGGTIAALDVGQGQCLAVLSGADTLLIDCGGMGTVEDAGETAGKYLISRGRKRVDVLVLTHWDQDHCNGIPMLLEMCDVRSLILPENPAEENGIATEILRSAERHQAKIGYLTEDSLLRLGDIRAELYAAPQTGSSNDRGIVSLVSLGAYDMFVTGDMSAKRETEWLEQHPVKDVELYIVGHHGSRTASSPELLEALDADTAIVSCGYNTYGHPAQETLERLSASGYTVYRTDENGTIEIRIRDENGKEKELRRRKTELQSGNPPSA